MKKSLLKAGVLSILALTIISCSSIGMPEKMVEASSFHRIKPPYVFLLKSIRITDKDGFPTGENFINDFLVSAGYKYGFRFIFPKPKDKTERADIENTKNTIPYLMDLTIKEKDFQRELKELTSISATLHIYRNTGAKDDYGVLESLLYQIVLTEESMVSIDSYHKLYQVINEIFSKLSGELKKRKPESAGKSVTGKLVTAKSVTKNPVTKNPAKGK